MQNLIKFIIKMAKPEQLIATQGLMDRFTVIRSYELKISVLVEFLG